MPLTAAYAINHYAYCDHNELGFLDSNTPFQMAVAPAQVDSELGYQHRHYSRK